MAISINDRKTLAGAGINDMDALAVAAAAFVREHQLTHPLVATNALSTDEELLLRAAGAVIPTDENAAGPSNRQAMAAQYAQLIASAYSQAEVARLLDVTTSRVRQRTDNGSLYAIVADQGRVYPRWQFNTGQTLPGLAMVLRAINEQAHPLAVERFMLTPHPDLSAASLGEALCPRDWLLTGHDVHAVVLMAAEL